jgi:hypothetical protein
LSFKPNRRSPWSRFAQPRRRRWPAGVVLADAAYGINTEFREGLTQLELQYVVGERINDGHTLRTFTDFGSHRVPNHPPCFTDRVRRAQP